MINKIEQFNLYISYYLCKIFPSKIMWKYDYNLIGANFRRKRLERKQGLRL